jgi:putative cell wall-binding protein
MLKKLMSTMLTLIFIFSFILIPTSAYAATDAKILLTCDKQSYKIGETVVVSVKSESEVHIFGIQFQINYDPTALAMVGSGMKLQGKYTTVAGTTVDQVKGILIYPLINYTNDKNSPSTDIAQVSFKTLKAGAFKIDLTDIKAVDDKSNLVSYNTNTQLYATTSNEYLQSPQSNLPVSTSGDVKIALKQLAGLDRVDTSLLVAKEIYSDKKPDAIVLTSANDFPDGLVGSQLAYKYNAPLLLVNKSVMESQKVLDYISTNLNKDKNIYLLGGTGAVSSSISDYLMAEGYNVIRLGGKDRYETNQKIVDYLKPVKGTSLVISNGEEFADALSISSVADIKGYSVLLNNKDTLQSNVRNYMTNIQPLTIYILGQEGAISANIETEIKALNPNVSIVRLGGKDRFETASKIADYFNLSTTITVASGINFPDALSGSVLAARKNSNIFLADKSYFKDGATDVYVIGGGITYEKK